VQFRVRAPDWQHRSRASDQVGFISYAELAIIVLCGAAIYVREGTNVPKAARLQQFDRGAASHNHSSEKNDGLFPFDRLLARSSPRRNGGELVGGENDQWKAGKRNPCHTREPRDIIT